MRSGPAPGMRQTVADLRRSEKPVATVDDQDQVEAAALSEAQRVTVTYRQKELAEDLQALYADTDPNWDGVHRAPSCFADGGWEPPVRMVQKPQPGVLPPVDCCKGGRLPECAFRRKCPSEDHVDGYIYVAFYDANDGFQKMWCSFRKDASADSMVMQVG